MIRRFILVLTFGMALVSADRLLAAAVDAIIPSAVCEAHGLTRAWMEQMAVDSSRARVTHVVLDAGMLFVSTDRSQIQAFDAETGRPIWTEAKQIGKPDLVSYPFAVNHSLVAAVNGSHLYVLNRYTGELLWDKVLENVAGTGPTLGDQHVFVPLGNGKVVAYRLKSIVNPLKELGKTTEAAAANSDYTRDNLRISQEFSTPLGLQSSGVVRVQPVMGRQTVDDESIIWASETGYVFVSVFDHAVNTFTMKFRIAINGGVDASPIYIPPTPKPTPAPKAEPEADDKPADNAAEPAADDAAAAKPKPKQEKGKLVVDTSSGTIFVVSRKGLAYAISERTGQTIWQFAITEPIVYPAAVIGPNVFITTQLGGLYCLDVATGVRKWWSPGVRQFVAQSKDRLYTTDGDGRLMILDPQNGVAIDSMPISAYKPLLVANGQNDRLYMVSRGGLIQCFHEPAIPQPLVYATPHLLPVEKAKTTKKEEGAAHAKPATEKPAAAEPAAPKPKANVDPLEKPEKTTKTPRAPKGKK